MSNRGLSHATPSSTARALFEFGIIPKMGVSKPCVYVIELNDAVRNDKKFVAKNPVMRPDKVCVYVGSTGRDPDIRFAQHLDGYKSCRYCLLYTSPSPRD